MARTLEYIEGVIESANERGVKIGANWYNYSRYAQNGAIKTHAKGDRVRIGVDGQGFVRELEVLERPAQAQAQPSSPVGSTTTRLLDAQQYARLQALTLAGPLLTWLDQKGMPITADNALQEYFALADMLRVYIETGEAP